MEWVRDRDGLMGLVYLYTGTGGGKTVSALGLALRSSGHKQRVVMVQFMKGRKTVGEYKVQKMLAPYYRVKQFGRGSWVKLGKPAEKDKELALKGLEYAKKVLVDEKPDLLILDEVNLAVAAKLLKAQDVLALLAKIPKKTNVVMTGRHAPRSLRERADFVNVVSSVKHPQKPWKITTKGIQY